MEAFFGFVIGILFVVTLVVTSDGGKTIKSEVKIEPKIELIIKDNKVDTLYVYKIK